MDYPEARTWLDSLGEFHMEFGLDRVRTVLAELGNPERCAPAIHIAGTNGKGMTCAYASAILRSAGKRVGLYTSPHLSRPNERIAISGFPVDDAAFADALTRVRTAIDVASTKLTYFEAITCAAFVAFREAKVEVMVLEVGLGGRLDATNVVDPAVCVITHVSLDHTALLGATVDEIAAEKAGIVKPGRPVVVNAAEPAIRRAVDAREAGGRVWTCGVAGEVGESATTLRLPARDEFRWFGVVRPLSSRCVASAAMAAVAVCLLDPAIGIEAIRFGVPSASWPGRAETLLYTPYTDPRGVERTIRLDGAHNPAAAATVSEWPDAPGRGPHVLLLAAMSDKDRLGILRALSAQVPGAVVCTSTGTARSASARLLAEEARSVFGDRVPVEAVEPVDAAFARACEAVSPGAGIVVTGSLYLVGRVREIVTGGPPTAIG